MTLRRGLIVALAALLWQAPGALSAQESAPAYTAIQRAFLRERFEEAAGLAQSFILQHPQAEEAPRVWIWLAISLDRVQRTGEALRELDRLLERLPAAHPQRSEALFWEADISRRALQTVRAKVAYQRLLEREPGSTWAPQARLGLGLIYLHQQDFEAARERFQAVIAKHGDTPAALDASLYLAYCHLRLQEHDRAVALLTDVSERLKDSKVVAQASFYLGESLSALKRYDEAAAAYLRAVSSAGASTWGQLARFGLGWVYYRSNRCRESVEAFDRYLADAVADHHSEVLFAQASCLIRLGRDQEALSRFERIMAREPGSQLAVDSGLALVDAYRARDQLGRANTLLQSLLRWDLTQVSRAGCQVRLAGISLEEGNAAKAQTIYELAAGSPDADVRQRALSGLGDVRLFLGRIEPAAEAYDQAVAVEAQTSIAHYAAYQRARIHVQRGEHEAATGLFQRLIATADGAVVDDARLGLALVYLLQGEEALARQALEAVRRRGPAALAARAGYYEALLALQAREEEQARVLCEEVLAAAPRSEEAIEARLLLADLMSRRTSVGDAVRWLTGAYASGELPARQRGRIAKRLGDFARQQGAYTGAVRWYDEAERLLPALRGETRYRIASCYEAAGDLEQAMATYGRITQDPWRVRGHLALGKLLERQGRLKDAVQVYAALADEPIAEAKVVRERLTALRQGLGDEE